MGLGWALDLNPSLMSDLPPRPTLSGRGTIMRIDDEAANSSYRDRQSSSSSLSASVNSSKVASSRDPRLAHYQSGAREQVRGSHNQSMLVSGSHVPRQQQHSSISSDNKQSNIYRVRNDPIDFPMTERNSRTSHFESQMSTFNCKPHQPQMEASSSRPKQKGVSQTITSSNAIPLNISAASNRSMPDGSTLHAQDSNRHSSSDSFPSNNPAPEPSQNGVDTMQLDAPITMANGEGSASVDASLGGDSAPIVYCHGFDKASQTYKGKKGFTKGPPNTQEQYDMVVDTLNSGIIDWTQIYLTHVEVVEIVDEYPPPVAAKGSSATKGHPAVKASPAAQIASSNTIPPQTGKHSRALSPDERDPSPEPKKARTDQIPKQTRPPTQAQVDRPVDNNHISKIQVDEIKQHHNRYDGPSPDTAMQEKVKQDIARMLSARQENARQENVRQESARQESSKQEIARRESSRHDGSKHESSRYDNSRHESSRRDSSRHDTGRYESSRQDSRFVNSRKDSSSRDSPRRESSPGLSITRLSLDHSVPPPPPAITSLRQANELISSEANLSLQERTLRNTVRLIYSILEDRYIFMPIGRFRDLYNKGRMHISPALTMEEVEDNFNRVLKEHVVVVSYPPNPIATFIRLKNRDRPARRDAVYDVAEIRRQFLIEANECIFPNTTINVNCLLYLMESLRPKPLTASEVEQRLGNVNIHDFLYNSSRAWSKHEFDHGNRLLIVFNGVHP